MRKPIRRTGFWLYSLFNRLCPKNRKQIVFYSCPDLSDNSFALFNHLHQTRSGQFKSIWLIEEPGKVEDLRSMVRERLSHSQEELRKLVFVDRNSVHGYWMLARSKYVFTTHSIFKRHMVPPGQVVINLWHGMPIKTIGHLDRRNSDADIGQCTYTISTSTKYQSVMAQAFALPTDRVWVTGLPRCDWFHEKTANQLLPKLGIDPDLRKILWAPTYRKVKSGAGQADGEFSGGLPVVKVEDFGILDRHLHEMGAQLIIKLHPLDGLNQVSFDQFENIRILKDEELLKAGYQFYQLLSEVEVLLTDYSSIFIDYLITDRPILFVLDDFSAYGSSRGFVDENPNNLMPGFIASDFDSLVSELRKIIVEGRDEFSGARQRVNLLCNRYDRSFSERVLENVGI